MRVTLLSHNAREADAIGNQLAGKVSFLTQHGWEVRLYVESTDRLHPAVAPCTRRHNADSLWNDRSERAFLQESDLILAEYGMAYGLLDLLPALAGGKPRIVMDYYGVTPPELCRPELRRRLEESQRRRGLVWFADRVLVHSRFSARELTDATGCPGERLRQLPCFTDYSVESVARPESSTGVTPAPNTPVEDSGRATARAGRATLGLKHALVLLFVGRLAANKRVPVLIEAVALLRELVPPVHAVIVGDHSDLYAQEADECRRLAADRHVADRLHLLGRLDEPALRDWYRSADLFVMPSAHEGYCLPVVEAMAAGLPVVAARAGALPETVGDAGLTFRVDDPADLARHVRKLMAREGEAPAEPLQLAHSRLGRSLALPTVAIVSPRYGEGFAGGAERSLRTIARALRQAGRRVEVFTTCNRHESDWADHLPPGDSELDGLTVHRFPMDRVNPEEHLAALEAIRRHAGRVSAEEEQRYLRNSLNSTALLNELEKRRDEFEAIVAGPYLFGLTWEAARRFGRRVVVLPCFHDEPFAYLDSLHEAYREVGGVFYHSEEEQHFVEAELGVNHPNAELIGTYLEPSPPGDAARGRDRCGDAYVLYCGRYSPEKGVDELLRFAERHAAEKPGRFRFVLMGQSGAVLPARPWLLDLGFVPDEEKRDLLAGARALVQLSKNESLSLVVLEAWAAGVPVIGHRDCAVIRGQIERSGGGRVIGNDQEFAGALDDLWSEPDRWRELGEAGKRYVERHYSSRAAFAARVLGVIDDLRTPLWEQMRTKGLRRARRLAPSVWRECFAGVLAEVIDQPREPGSVGSVRLEVEPQTERKTVAPDAGVVLVPVRITNRGTLPAVDAGPARTEISVRVSSAKPRAAEAVRLPALLLPGQTSVAVVPVAVPPKPGSYQVFFDTAHSAPSKPLQLEVSQAGAQTDAGAEASFLEQVEKALVEAEALSRLPDDYHDVTEGLLANFKRKLKRKLLHQFRKSYVDVLSRQQSAFNEKVLLALAQLRDCCSVLGQTAARNDVQSLSELIEGVLREQRRLRRSQAKLQRRLKALERAFGVADQRS